MTQPSASASSTTSPKPASSVRTSRAMTSSRSAFPRDHSSAKSSAASATTPTGATAATSGSTSSASPSSSPASLASAAKQPTQQASRRWGEGTDEQHVILNRDLGDT